MAFEPDTLRRVRELEPSVRTALLIGRGRTQRDRVWPAEAVERAREVGAGHLGMNHRLLDADVVTAARRAGIMVAAWTVNEEADIRRVVALGVDVVITDRPDLARRVLGR
jgi:glycerophosphoryl diester phosphodiesterase